MRDVPVLPSLIRSFQKASAASAAIASISKIVVAATSSPERVRAKPSNDERYVNSDP